MNACKNYNLRDSEDQNLFQNILESVLRAKVIWGRIDIMYTKQTWKKLQKDLGIIIIIIIILCNTE